MDRSLSEAQIELYSRQILLPELGGIGQKRLLASACLVAGDDAAAAFAATYLAGAGVGRIDLLGTGGAERRVGLPEIAERNPEVEVALRQAVPSRLDGYDVVVASGDGPARLASAAARARRGEVRIELPPESAVPALAVLPASAPGCASCGAVDATDAAPRSDDAALADPAAAELAGALAALAACRWIGGLADEPEPRAWQLPADAPVWQPAEVVRTRPCPRGCPP